MTHATLTFTRHAPQDDTVDPEYRCAEHPNWAIQDATAYRAGYVVFEFSRDDAPEAWMREHGTFHTLKAAKAALTALAAQGGAA